MHVSLLPRHRPPGRSCLAQCLLAGRDRPPRALPGQRHGIRRLGSGEVAHQGERSVHIVANLSITLRGIQAAVETYFTASRRDRDAQGIAPEVFLAGRYSTASRSAARSGASRSARWCTTGYGRWARPRGSEAERFGPRQPIGGVRGDDPVHALLAAMQQPGGQDDPRVSSSLKKRASGLSRSATARGLRALGRARRTSSRPG